MNYPILSLHVSTGNGADYNLVTGTRVSFGLGNAFGYFLEKKLNFWNINRHRTPYLFHLAENGHIIPSNCPNKPSEYDVVLGGYVYLYFSPEGRNNYWMLPPLAVKFPAGTVVAYISESGYLSHGDEIASYSEEGPLLVRIPMDSTLKITEAVGRQGTKYAMQQRWLKFQPRMEHLKYSNRGIHFRGWDFSDESYNEAFPSGIITAG